MKNVYLKVPTLSEVKYRKKWMMDPKTMEYNAGYDASYEGYNKQNGTIDRSDEMLESWFHKWIGFEPDKYFAYIYDNNIKEPVGEIYYYLDGNIHNMGILIQYKYRGNGYSLPALLELEKIAFDKNNVSELSDMIPLCRKEAINSFKKAGFVPTDKKQISIVFSEEEIEQQLLITKEMYIRSKQ